MKRAFCLFMLFFAFLAFSQTARAQEYVYSVSHIEQFGDTSDPSSVMAGYSGTGMTYGIAQWYDAVNVSTLERDGMIIDQQASENFPSTFNFTSTQVVAGSVYDQYTDSILRIVFPYVCGVWYDAYGFSAYSYLPYDDSNQWPPFPAICVGVELIYLGYTVAEEQGNPPQPKCTETCRPCKRDKLNREIICGAAATACEIAAYSAYQNGLLNCSNQAFCNPSSPMFNQQQCDNCKAAARNTFVAATAACGSAATGCFLTVPDCSGKVSCPNGPNGDPAACN
jgi:hypothetical protein